jgi:hypothetical protein
VLAPADTASVERRLGSAFGVRPRDRGSEAPVSVVVVDPCRDLGACFSFGGELLQAAELDRDEQLLHW